MKFFVLLFVASLVFGASWYVVSAANTTRDCYIEKGKDLDDLAYKLRSFGGDKTQLCTASYEQVDSLGVCLTNADASLPVQLRPRLQPMVTKVLGLLRNGEKELKGFQDAHDAVCSEYPDMMFTPPDYLVR